MAKIKVVPRSLTEAYKKREGDFSPNLVGLQFTENTSFFTFGNFEITTNLDSRVAKDFILGGEWSDYYNLQNLKVTQSQSKNFVSNEIFVRLNFDPNNISRYVYFGSFYEYARVTLEQIIQKWKGGIYLNPTLTTNVPVNTVLSFTYDSGSGIADFLIPKSVISNPFELIVDDNTDFNNIAANEIYNLSLSYKKYVISNTSGDFNVVGYTGSTTNNPYIRVQTKGNPFPNLNNATFGQTTYFLKPNDIEIELFFQELNDFEKILLNRLTTPIYTATFDVPVESDGVTFQSTRIITWPVSDGYNIDINTRDYALYVENLLDIASNFDANKTDLVSRRFVSESIHEFDTNGGGDPVYGMKVTKLLKIYGREFDEVKKYIDGISFANVVTYDKLDNTSDELIKILAKNLGFDVLLTVTTDNFDLLQQITTTPNTPFSGYSRSLSAKELDIELWRRLIVNAWWLYKSKGTRKVFEFFFNLFKMPECMLTLNEYIYLASDRLDVGSVYTELQKIYNDPTFSFLDTNPLPMDNFGFPLPLTQTVNNYFQNDGFWYNNGTDVTIGNNPHIGPYDIGAKYLNPFKCFVPNFNTYLTGLTNVNEFNNYFEDFNKGTFNFSENSEGLIPSYPNYTAISTNSTINSAGLVTFPELESPTFTVPEGDIFSLKINFKPGDAGTTCNPCGYNLEYDTDGYVYVMSPREKLNDVPCCQHFTTVANECYWCALQTTEVCTSNEYLTYFTPQQIQDQALTLGWNYVGLPGQYIQQILDNVFDADKCILLDTTQSNPNVRVIKNRECCELRGGTVISSNGNYFCTTQVINLCPTNIVINSHVLFDGDTNTLVSQECCTAPYYYFQWDNTGQPGTIFVYDTSGSYTTKVDVVGLQQAQTAQNSKSYCSQCPKDILINAENNVVNYNTPTENLSSQCCTDYGYSYNSATQKCSQCPSPTVNNTTAPYQISFPAGTSSLQTCCTLNGGYYYGYPNFETPACWSCPNPNLYEISSDNFITVGGADVTQQCCTSYGVLTNTQVTFENGRCKIPNNVILTADDLIYVTSNGNVYKRTLAVGEFSPSTNFAGVYSTFNGPSDLLLTLLDDFKPQLTTFRGQQSTYRPHSITYYNNTLSVLNTLGTKIAIYNITPNPWSVSGPTIRDIPGLPVRGLFRKNQTTYLSTRKDNNGQVWVVEISINVVNGNISVTNKFLLTANTGGGTAKFFDSNSEIVSISLTTGNKLIVISYNPNSEVNPGFYINQYYYGTQPYYDQNIYYVFEMGALEMQQQLDFVVGYDNIDNPYGFYTFNDEKYTFNGTAYDAASNYISGNIYKIENYGTSGFGDIFKSYGLISIGGDKQQYYINDISNQPPLQVLGVTQIPLQLNFLIDYNDLGCPVPNTYNTPSVPDYYYYQLLGPYECP